MTKKREKEEDVIEQKDIEKEVETELEEVLPEAEAEASIEASKKSDTAKETKKEYPRAIAGILIVNKNGKLLFCRSHKWKDQFTIFGGKVDLGESMEDAAVREAKEETGLDVKVKASLGISDSIFDPGFYEKKHFVFIDFLCEYAGEDDQVSANQEYTGECVWVTLAEAKKLDLAAGAKLILKEYEEYLQKQDYLEGWKRCQADFENYKKRQADSAVDMIRYANEGLVLQIIPVLDNFHASTAHVPAEQKDNGWVTGIMYIQKQLEQVLKDSGVTEIEAQVGKNFDPKFHEAVDEGGCDACETKEKYKNKIKKVVQKGYAIGERVIRPSRVVVE